MRNPTITVVTIPINEAGLAPLSNLVDVLSSLTANITLITGGAGYSFFKDDQRLDVHEVGSRPGANIVARVAKHALTQLRISCKLTKAGPSTDLFVFFLGGPMLLLPLLTARLFRKQVAMILTGSQLRNLQAQNDPLSGAAAFLVNTSYALASRLVVYSEKHINQWGLERYRNKVSIAHERFIDFNKFSLEKPLSQRPEVVGYAGRLSEEKGILNLMEAIPRVMERRPVARFRIAGGGQLRHEVEEYANSQKLKDRVDFVGWIARDELSSYLNELKLLVLPSYTEGLPTIMLEAMACGTPVLGTPVGAIPDVITDSATGFIMEDNSPQCITENTTRALNHPELDTIARNARALVEREYTYEAVLEGYKSLLSEWGIETDPKESN